MRTGAWITYDDLRISNGSIQWSFSGFEREVDSLIAMLAESRTAGPRIGSTQDYLKAQRSFIEASDEFDCELLVTPGKVPYLRPSVRKQSACVIAKLIIYEGCFMGPAIRPGYSDEKLRFQSARKAADWMIAEVDEPSMNFCTVIGEYD